MAWPQSSGICAHESARRNLRCQPTIWDRPPMSSWRRTIGAKSCNVASAPHPLRQSEPSALVESVCVHLYSLGRSTSSICGVDAKASPENQATNQHTPWQEYSLSAVHAAALSTRAHPALGLTLPNNIHHLPESREFNPPGSPMMYA